MDNPNQFTRREFFKAMLASASSYIISKLPNQNRVLAYDESTLQLLPGTFTTPEWRYAVPDSIQPIESKHIEQIVDYLDSKQNVGLSAPIVPSLIDLIQFNHYKLTGMGYREHMRKRYGYAVSPDENPANNPIEVVLVGNLHKNHDPGGYFIHSTKQGETNKAFVNVNSSPSIFLNYLGHELVHAVYGTGEMRAYAYNHRDIANMMALFPKLMREDDSNCPLMGLMKEYLSSIILKNHEGKIRVGVVGGGRDRFKYLALLLTTNSDKWKTAKGTTSIDKVVESLVDRQNDLLEDSKRQFETLLNEYERLSLDKKDAWVGFAAQIAENFADKTEEYILQKNPDFPADRKDLLKKKMEKIRNRVF